MMTALRGSVSTLCWSIIIFATSLSFFALFMSQILRLIYLESDEMPIDQRRELYRYFGTFTKSLFTMFELAFANWPPVSRMLGENCSEWFMMLAVIFKLSMGFAVIGVVNGIFMQETMTAAFDDQIMIRRHERSRHFHDKKMHQLFEKLDKDGSGQLDCTEVVTALKDKSVREWLASMDISFTVPESKIFALIDVDNDKSLSFEELKKGIAHIKGPARSIDLITLTREVREMRDMLRKSCEQSL